MRKPSYKKLQEEIKNLNSVIDNQRSTLQSTVEAYRKKGFEEGVAHAKKEMSKSLEIEMMRARTSYISALGQALHSNAELPRAGSIVIEPRQI